MRYELSTQRTGSGVSGAPFPELLSTRAVSDGQVFVVDVRDSAHLHVVLAALSGRGIIVWELRQLPVDPADV
jgi:hypothetical protein